jgi:hypothetical protein
MLPRPLQGEGWGEGARCSLILLALTLRLSRRERE